MSAKRPPSLRPYKVWILIIILSIMIGIAADLAGLGKTASASTCRDVALKTTSTYPAEVVVNVCYDRGKWRIQ